MQVFTGPIRARLEGREGWSRHSCGREGPPITTLDLGSEDTDRVRYAWGANMAIRRAALERIGPFDVTLEHAGDEQEWQDRLTAACGDGRVLYVAAAALDHRRAGPDARLRALARAARLRGRAARSFDAWHEDGRRSAPVTRGAHAGRMRGPRRALSLPAMGSTLLAHSLGRLEQALRERHGHVAQPRDRTAGESDDFLSGESGTVGGLDAVRRELRDRLTTRASYSAPDVRGWIARRARCPRGGACWCLASRAPSTAR